MAELVPPPGRVIYPGEATEGSFVIFLRKQGEGTDEGGEAARARTRDAGLHTRRASGLGREQRLHLGGLLELGREERGEAAERDAREDAYGHERRHAHSHRVLGAAVREARRERGLLLGLLGLLARAARQGALFLSIPAARARLDRTSASRPRAPRNIPVAAAAYPRPVRGVSPWQPRRRRDPSAEYLRGSRGVAATRPRRRRDPSAAYPRPVPGVAATRPWRICAAKMLVAALLAAACNPVAILGVVALQVKGPARSKGRAFGGRGGDPPSSRSAGRRTIRGVATASSRPTGSRTIRVGATTPWDRGRSASSPRRRRDPQAIRVATAAVVDVHADRDFESWHILPVDRYMELRTRVMIVEPSAETVRPSPPFTGSGVSILSCSIQFFPMSGEVQKPFWFDAAIVFPFADLQGYDQRRRRVLVAADQRRGAAAPPRVGCYYTG